MASHNGRGDWLGRWTIGLATGFWLAMLTGNPYIAVWSWIFIWFVSRTVVAAAFLVQHLQQSYCGQGCIEGWGCYYAMAENLPVLHPGDHSDCAGESRGGMFDWLLGKPLWEWTESRRFLRDFSGMFLRGYVWLVTTGIGLHSAGYGVAPLLAGGVSAATVGLGRDCCRSC